ncbi:50S ribosomal protein L19 [Patescibacteria group bacterium]|nr:50S ribosomal protein L19 [Patescibacteria group bacterium]
MAIKIIHNKKTFSVGDTVRINYKIKEGDKQRIQAFDGIIISAKGDAEHGTFIVKREATDKVNVERIFPIDSPWISSIEKIKSPKTKIRRAKLYFLRDPKTRKI